jgi:hypothetical protein
MGIRKQHLIGANGYNPTHYSFYNQTNSAGGGAGQSVTIGMATTFQDQYGTGVLLSNGQYCVSVTPNQSATAYVTGKTTSGFSVVLTPLPTTATLAAGQFDVLIMGGR